MSQRQAANLCKPITVISTSYATAAIHTILTERTNDKLDPLTGPNLLKRAAPTRSRLGTDKLIPKHERSPTHLPSSNNAKPQLWPTSSHQRFFPPPSPMVAPPPDIDDENDDDMAPPGFMEPPSPTLPPPDNDEDDYSAPVATFAAPPSPCTAPPIDDSDDYEAPIAYNGIIGLQPPCLPLDPPTSSPNTTQQAPMQAGLHIPMRSVAIEILEAPRSPDSPPPDD